MVKLICLNCKKFINGRNNKSKFCSQECCIAYKTYYKECLNCRKQFKIRKYRQNTAKFCSRKCRSEYESVKKQCLYCNKIFKVGKSVQNRTKFCSKQCRSNYEWDKGKWFNCKNCDIRFHVGSYKAKTAQFCSKKCQKEFYNGDTYLKCFVCEKQFIRKKWEIKSKKKYCSEECYYKRSPKIYVNCSGCGKKVKIYQSRRKYYNSIYCSNSCYIKYGCIGKLSYLDNFNSNYQKFVRSLRHKKEYYEWRKKCLQRDNYKCVVCNKNKKITVHHSKITIYDFVKKYGFDKEKIYADPIFFHVNNGITYCRRCHFKKHRIRKEIKNEN